MADNTAKIAEIREILRSGVKQFSNDGTSFTHDFKELRKELERLIADDDTETQTPSVLHVDLSGY